MVWYKKECLILNIATDKALNIDKRQNTRANKILSTAAKKTVNANKKWNTIAKK